MCDEELFGVSPYCSALNDDVVWLEFTVSLPYEGPASPRRIEAIHPPSSPSQSSRMVQSPLPATASSQLRSCSQWSDVPLKLSPEMAHVLLVSVSAFRIR